MGWGWGARATSFLLDEMKKGVGSLFSPLLRWRIPNASVKPERLGFYPGLFHQLSASLPGSCGVHRPRLQRVAGTPTPL